jgi:hypothetical protein
MPGIYSCAYLFAPGYISTRVTAGARLGFRQQVKDQGMALNQFMLQQLMIEHKTLDTEILDILDQSPVALTCGEIFKKSTTARTSGDVSTKLFHYLRPKMLVVIDRSIPSRGSYWKLTDAGKEAAAKGNLK